MRGFTLVAIILLAGCAARREPRANMMVLPYQELGPQVAAHEVIGFEWYQWNAHGDPDPGKTDDVKIVIYRDIPLERVKEAYPVIKGKQDYRYLDYATAMSYLSRYEKEPYLEHLQGTKKKVLEQLGP